MEMVMVGGVERSGNIAVTLYHTVFRTIGIELSRILNHILAITTHAIDLGAITPLL